MASHTQGPWKVSAADPSRVLANDERRTVIAEVTGSWSNKESMADARLIAAAPDLLAALKDLVDQTCALLDWTGATAELLNAVPRPQGPDSRKINDAVEGGRAWVSGWSKASGAAVAARAAIAKAEGR